MSWNDARKEKMRLKDYVISAIRTHSPQCVENALDALTDKELLTAFLEYPGTNENSILCEAVKTHHLKRDEIARLVIDAAIQAEAIYIRRDKTDYWGAEIDAAHPVLDRRNAAGLTALHQAARMNNPKAAARLIEAGASALIKDDYGMTAYETAIAVWQAAMDRQLSADASETVPVSEVHEMVSKGMDAILKILRTAEETQKAALEKANGVAPVVVAPRPIRKNSWIKRAVETMRGSSKKRQNSVA